jgi:hypothetical protein
MKMHDDFQLFWIWNEKINDQRSVKSIHVRVWDSDEVHSDSIIVKSTRIEQFKNFQQFNTASHNVLIHK